MLIKSVKSVAVLVFSALLLFWVYYSSFTIDFAVHNDYRSRDHLHYTFDPSTLQGMLQHDESMHLLYIGRPLNAILFNFQQVHLKEIKDFAKARLISFFTLLTVVGMLYLHLIKCNKITSIYIGLVLIGMLLLPSSALYINWISNYVPGPFNLLLALVGWMLFDLGLSVKAVVSKWLLFTLVYVILIASCLIYPATTFFFLFVPLVRILFVKGNWDKTRMVGIKAILIMAVVMLSYFLLQKKIFFPFFQDYFGSQFESYDPQTYNFSFALNAQFFTLMWQSAEAGLSLFFTQLNNHVVFLLNFVLISCAVVASYAIPSLDPQISEKTKNKNVTQKIAMAVVILGMTLAPILLTSNGFVAYRILFVFFAMCLAICIHSYSVLIDVLRLYCRVRMSMVFLIPLAISLFLGVQNNNALVKNSQLEYDYFKKRIDVLPQLISKNNKPVRIVVVLPNRYEPFVDYELPYDLVYTATNYSGFMSAITHLLAEQINISRDNYKIVVLNFAYDHNFVLPQEIKDCQDCLLIDTRQIRHEPRKSQ